MKKLLQAEHLHARLRRLLDEGHVGRDHLLADLLGRVALHVALEAHLDEPGLHHRHRRPSSGCQGRQPRRGILTQVMARARLT